MKKILVGIMVAITMLCICGCGEKSPSDTVKEALDAAKNQDTETVNSVYLGSDLSFDKLFSSDSTTTELDAQTLALLEQKLLDFDYTIDKEKISDNTAKVTVTITTYDFGTAVQGFISEAITKAFASSLSGESEDEINADFSESANNTLAGLTEKSKVQEATITLTKDKDGWAIDDVTENTEFLDAITGGGYSAVNDIADNLSDMGLTEED